MQANQREVDEEDDCAICNESLPTKQSSNVARMICCGKATHMKCRDNIYKSSMSDEQKGRCIMCRTKHAVTGSKEEIDRLQRWVEKGKAWAQFMLGSKYDRGDGVEQSYQQAKELYELAASQGEADAQYNLGLKYDKGLGVDQSYERAAEYWEAAASQGVASAQFHLGVMYTDGLGVEQNNERAAEYMEAAARQGDADAQCSLGLLYVIGEGVEQSFEKARAWLMKSAEEGNENAITSLQQIDEFEGRTTPSFTPPKRCSTCDIPKTSTHKLRNCKCKGAQYCNAKCQKTHWKSHKKEHHRLCKEMKLTNTEGEMKDEVVVEEEEQRKEVASAGLQQQKEEDDVCPVCIEPLQKDTSKFIRFSCCGKGIHFWCREEIDASGSLSQEQKDHCPLCRAEHPDSVEKAIEQLLPWVEKGKAWAQSSLGQKYRGGEGVDQSWQRAKELFELAASQGETSSQYNLGIMYANGLGVNQSYERAKEYYEAAARQGHAHARSSLGCLFCNGQGVEKSIEKARELWMKSAEQGDETAIEGLQQLDEFEGRTTPSFVPKPFECAICYRPHDPSEHKLRPCKRCHRVYYCGKECQVKHWKRESNGHKKMCNKKTK